MPKHGVKLSDYEVKKDPNEGMDPLFTQWLEEFDSAQKTPPRQISKPPTCTCGGARDHWADCQLKSYRKGGR